MKLKIKSENKHMTEDYKIAVEMYKQYQKDVIETLSKYLADEIDKAILNELFEASMRENIKIIEEMFPNEDISEVLKKLGITDSELKLEYQLKEKIRDWKIKSIMDESDISKL